MTPQMETRTMPKAEDSKYILKYTEQDLKDAEDEMREACAKVAEDNRTLNRHHLDIGRTNEALNELCDVIAAAIRARNGN